MLAVLMQGCDQQKNDIPEGFLWKKPTSKTFVIEFDDRKDDTTRYNWQDSLITYGPGTFISAIVSKKGGSGGSATGSLKTTVRLTIDRKEVLMKSFEVASAMGLSRQNYSGIVWLEGAADSVETLVLGYSEELYFTERLILGIKVDDPEVKKVFLSVTYTKQDTGEDEDTGGGDGEPSFP